MAYVDILKAIGSSAWEFYSSFDDVTDFDHNGTTAESITSGTASFTTSIVPSLAATENCLTFSGSGLLTYSGSAFAPSAVTALSGALWISPSSVDTTKRPIWFQGGGARGISIFTVDESSVVKLYVVVWEASGATRDVLVADIDESAHFVAFNFDFNSDTASLWVDGTEVDTLGTLNIASTHTGGTARTDLGGAGATWRDETGNLSAAANWIGEVAQYGIWWDYALTQTDVDDLYESGLGGTALTGSAVTTGAGTATANVTYALTGSEVSVGAGTITASTGNTEALTGEEVAVGAGTLIPVISYAVTGEEVAVGDGALTEAISYALAGEEVAAGAGTVTASQAGTEALTGEEVATGDGTVTPSVSYAATGSEVAAGAGTIEPEIWSVGTATAAFATGAASLTPDYSALSPQTDDILWALATWNDDTVADISAPASQGWTEVFEQNHSGNLISARLWWKRWGSGDTDDDTPTFTFAATAALAGGVAGGIIRGCENTGSPVDVFSVANRTGTLTLTAPDATVTQTGAHLRTRLFAMDDNNPISAYSEGQELLYDQHDPVGSDEDLAIFGSFTNSSGSGAVGTSTATQDSGTADDTIAITVVWRAADPDETDALTGSEVAVGSGTVTNVASYELTGSEIATESGTLATAISIALTGAEVTTETGTITSNQGATEALTGEEVTTGAGTMVQTVTVALSGSEVTTESGTITGGLVLPIFFGKPTSRKTMFFGRPTARKTVYFGKPTSRSNI